MIRSILVLQPEPAKVADVLAVYRDDDILQFSLNESRALASEISVALDGSGELVVTALWPDAAAYQEWLDHPRRANARLVEILRGVPVGAARLYEVDHEVRKP